MIDLDSFKQSEQSSDSYGAELIRLHRAREARELHSRLLSDWLRDNPGASADDCEFADLAAAVVAERRVA